MHKGLRILNYAIPCCLRLELLDKLLLNRTATEEDTCMSGFSYLSKVSVVQREKRIFQVTLKGLAIETRKIPFLRSVNSTFLICQKLAQAQQAECLTQIQGQK